MADDPTELTDEPVRDLSGYSRPQNQTSLNKPRKFSASGFEVRAEPHDRRWHRPRAAPITRV
ncbi:hypothetical protein SAMN05216215_103457 [Saccharopolyspora shandongensis]|uniref:Uncharacterized protein n=1 Tax=Saccharopolyspora shandongensis TaxID=418495 RepID=A0A1H3MH91_9PSEU|nr:hypothetical protein [Saccharopolyspora shandongensis]SDY76052.1 hypothetical protein SAMN05216215_103457 [Saccharopolyspora shandongensis]